MKKFLVTLILTIIGVLFFNSKSVYALTEMELEKIKDTCGFDESNEVSDKSKLNAYAIKGWCITKEADGTYFYYNTGAGTYTSSNLTFSPNGASYSYFKLDNIKSLEKWKWTNNDIQNYLSDKGFKYCNNTYITSSNVNYGLSEGFYYYDYSSLYIKADPSRNYSNFKGTACGVLRYDVADNLKNSQLDKETGVLFDATNMGKVRLIQHNMKGNSPYWRDLSCNQCAFDLLIQNSGLITDSNLQCSGLVNENSATWKAYCDAFRTSVAWVRDIEGVTGVFANSLANELKFFRSLTGNANWSSISGTSLEGTELEVTDQFIVKWGNKALTDMSKEEVSAMLKAFYNNDYFVILGIRDKDGKGNPANANGPQGYKGAHVVLFAGCKDYEVFFNDSSHGKVTSYTKDIDLYPNNSTPIRWMYAVKVNNGSTSTKSICGGGTVSITNTDKKAIEGLGISPSVLEKTIDSEMLIASSCKLMEENLESILDGVSRDSLTGDQLDSLNTWEELISDSSKQGGVLYWIRVIVMLLGIALIVWSVLLYVGFWFDRANNFIDISVVTILTLGKLATSDTDEEYTYGDKESKGIKTINSRILTRICILGILAGVLIVSGALYTLISKLVYFVMSLISKGG